jgi:hypothetical protein
MHLEVYLLNLINKSFFKTVLFFNCTCRKDSCNMDYLPSVQLSSNGNASEAKANEGFDNSIFFASEAKRTCSLEGNLLAKRSEHVRKK